MKFHKWMVGRRVRYVFPFADDGFPVASRPPTRQSPQCDCLDVLGPRSRWWFQVMVALEDFGPILCTNHMDLQNPQVVVLQVVVGTQVDTLLIWRILEDFGQLGYFKL